MNDMKTIKIKKKDIVILVVFVIVALLCLLYFTINLPVKERQNSGMKQPTNISRMEIVEACRQLCLRVKRENISLDNGPCLSDIYKNDWNFTGWVCDVAHWPRIPEIDNKNQCSNWGIDAFNFVEVTPDCEPIRIFEYGKGETRLIKQ